MQTLAKTLYTVSAEFDVGIIGQENKKVQRANVASWVSEAAQARRKYWNFPTPFKTTNHC